MFAICPGLSQIDLSKVEGFLRHAKALLPTGSFTIQQSEKNKEFDRKFNLRHDDKRKILQALTPQDCISVEPNNNPRYLDCEVYKFIKGYNLPYYGQIEQILLYIKMYIQEGKHDEMIIVISLHEEGMHD